ncbi:CUB and sushi domain-containing protein 1 [Collichthys lucidus]|uniref:CUB and sushi domain-containing protein 1 n=1 Tax=Collichthys lucidus TaxID=240159 RepID=A0A4V6ANQ9_COLLU|nr:CUB and sushi domain-containing protein 1 [Collichthys lucidus]
MSEKRQSVGDSAGPKKRNYNYLKSYFKCGFIEGQDRLSGFMLPSPIVSSGSILALWFTTDFAVSAQGFKAVYEDPYCKFTSGATHGVCIQLFNQRIEAAVMSAAAPEERKGRRQHSIDLLAPAPISICVPFIENNRMASFSQKPMDLAGKRLSKSLKEGSTTGGFVNLDSQNRNQRAMPKEKSEQEKNRCKYVEERSRREKQRRREVKRVRREEK